MCVTDRHDMTLAVQVTLNPNTTNQFMCVTDRHDMTLAVKVTLNPNTTNNFVKQPTKSGRRMFLHPFPNDKI